MSKKEAEPAGGLKDRLRAYYWLMKPGIIYGNILPAVAGFLLASHGRMYVSLFFGVIVGMALVIGSACVFNNYIDRDIDAYMARTSWRAMVQGTIPKRAALIFGTVLGLLGLGILARFTNDTTIIVGLIGFIDYVIFYTYIKRHSVHGTLVGSISGAMPPVAGYVAVTDHFDGAALILFLILTFWQMPHFYAISMYRLKDYKAAKIPVLPAVHGLKAAKQQIIIYTLLFLLASISLTIFGYTGYVYLTIVLVIGVMWLWRGLKGFNNTDDVAWAKKMFFFSLIVLVTTCAAITIDTYLNPKASALRNGCVGGQARNSEPPHAKLYS